VIVIVDVPAPVIEAGLKPTEMPVGCPLADREMAELNPPRMVEVIVDVPLPPALLVGTETRLGVGVRK
jgi:hypothetical protein